MRFYTFESAQISRRSRHWQTRAAGFPRRTGPGIRIIMSTLCMLLLLVILAAILVVAASFKFGVDAMEGKSTARIKKITFLSAFLTAFTTSSTTSASTSSSRLSSRLLGTADSESDSTQQLCVIVRTMPAHQYALPALLLSLFSDQSTRKNVRAVVINTDKPATGSGSRNTGNLELVVAAVNAVLGYDGVLLSGRQQADILALFPRLKSPDFGYLLTDAVIEDVIAAFIANSVWAQGPTSSYAEHRQSRLQQSNSLSGRHVIPPLPDLADAGWTCEFIMATNGDNVYTAEYIRAVQDALAFPSPSLPPLAPHMGSSSASVPAMQGMSPSRVGLQPLATASNRVSGSPGRGASLMATHWFSHYSLTTANVSYKKFLRLSRCGPLHTGHYAESVVSPVLRLGCVDLGAVALRTEVLATTGARFFANYLRRIDPEGLTPMTSSEGCAAFPPAYCADGALYSRLAEAVSARKDDAGLVIIRAPLYFHQ